MAYAIKGLLEKCGRPGLQQNQGRRQQKIVGCLTSASNNNRLQKYNLQTLKTIFLQMAIFWSLVQTYQYN